MTWSHCWFAALYAMIAIYAILDGFDFGAGIIHLFAGKEERRSILRAIAPFWDGNEVWLVAIGQFLFAAFPAAYGPILSALYLPVISLTAALVLRACAMEFRNKVQHPRWLQVWDATLFLASLASAGCYGFILGILTVGLPLTPQRYLDSKAMTWNSPFAIILAAMVICAFTLQGSTYLAVRLRGDFQRTLRLWASGSLAALVLLAIALIAAGESEVPHLYSPPISLTWPPLLALGGLLALAILWSLWRESDLGAFGASSALIAWGVAQFALANFPYLIRATNDPQRSLTAMNALASQHALFILTLVAAVGIPLVLGYTAWVYWVFWGPVESDRSDY